MVRTVASWAFAYLVYFRDIDDPNPLAAMRNSALLVLVGMLCLPVGTLAQQNSAELEPGYYVVVAAFGKGREDLARKYTNELAGHSVHASYGFNSTRNYFFVYVYRGTNLGESLREMEKTRERGEEFSRAWVRVIGGNPKTSETKEAFSSVVTSGAENPTRSEDKSELGADVLTNRVSRPSHDIEISFNEPIRQYPKITLANTEVFLSLFDAASDKIIDGKVTVVDAERTRALREVDGNDYIILPDPRSKSGKLTLLCEAFGYRKVQREINYFSPLADTAEHYMELVGTTLVLYFDMVRYRKGDVGIMFNVQFYNDAALMLPESKFQLGQLLELMQENPRYRIRLHGHTNGHYHGRILTRSPGQDLFSLEDARSTTGSAKSLSYARAEVVKEYLVENGIDADRIELKGWGGRRPLYDKHGVNARRNVRVEVEIIQE